ncbi:MAG: M20/M25/M40 family metallo-hydrolase [Anaerolineaceae bacterium]|nr:M20/M25/M40 family metallo-hydrolase [Anaerolineaceae bacterium]
MKTNYNWYDLLVLTGFMPERRDKEAVTLYLYGDDVSFLDSLLTRTQASYEKDCGRYVFRSTPHNSSDWFEEMKKLEGGMESGSHITTRDIEFPLNAVVMQFQRLNIRTIESCKGYHNQWQMHGPVRYRGPYVKFLTWRGALLAETILKSGGYSCELDTEKRLFILEAIDGILDLGLWLHKINCAYDYLKPLQEKRERRLLQLLDIPGKSKEEYDVASHVKSILENRLDSVWMDEVGNVLGELTIPGRKFGDKLPILLLSAHLDVKNSTGEGNAIIREENTLRRDGGILGADDRAGIVLILDVLDVLIKTQIPCHLKFAFTVEEETGQQGAEQINETFFQGLDFAISLDRKGTNDIVVRSSEYAYCIESEATFITECSKRLWKNPRLHFKPVQGGLSDLRVWSQLGNPYIPSVNLSIGYFDEHTPNERLELDSWHRVHDLLLEIISYKTEEAFRPRV